MELRAALVFPVVPRFAHHQHDVVAARVERDPVAFMPVGRCDDLEVPVRVDMEIVEIMVAEVALIRITPEALVRLELDPARRPMPAPNAVTPLAIEERPSVEEIRARRTEARLERHEDRVQVEVGVGVARRDVDVEAEGLQHLQQVQALRAHSGVARDVCVQNQLARGLDVLAALGPGFARCGGD